MSDTMLITMRRWNPYASDWETYTAEATPPPRKPARRKTRGRGAPCDLASLSTGSPLPSWWRDTAYAPGDVFADMRSYLPEPSIRTHRPATIPWSGETAHSDRPEHPGH